MKDTSGTRVLILETSGRQGHAALACGERLLCVRPLDESRRHARDLAPAVRELLVAENWKPADIQAVIVTRGPGSYTGLRVGIISAKVFAFATGAALIAIDTFAAIARQVGPEVSAVEVLADAQQDKIYVQRFFRSEHGIAMVPANSLTIVPVADWLQSRDPNDWVSGPCLHALVGRLPAESCVVHESQWDPTAESLLHIGLDRFHDGERDNPWTLEPLYLRPSAAEEKWQKKRGLQR